MFIPARLPYKGVDRKLVIAFDVGTTFSGASYCVLDPGEVPKVNGVNRFPAQETVGGDSKIPSIVYYNSKGLVAAVGAEALQEHIIEKADDEQWTKVEWFKLHLRPDLKKKGGEKHIDGTDIPPLPKGKTVVTVFSDFLHYLFQCTRTYFEETHAHGTNLWQSLVGTTEFILSHPNGWGGSQQNDMRRAAMVAGLVPDTKEGHDRVRFVTEGEASLHFCLNSNFASAATKEGEGIIIVDAGGGTVDLSAYALLEAPRSFQEVSAAECLFQGSVFVARRARTFLEGHLYKSNFGSPSDIDHIAHCFDKTTKLRFKCSTEPSYIKFGSARDRDLSVNIKNGQLKLDGADVAKFFAPAIEEIKDAVDTQIESSTVPVKAIFLVGGFAASDWLFQELNAHFSKSGVTFCRPDSHTNKAVADGAVSFYVDHYVSVRVAKNTYGCSMNNYYIESNPEHFARRDKVYTGISGERYVPDGFDVILYKDTAVSETTEFQRFYSRDYKEKDDASSFNQDIFCYMGEKAKPKWKDEETDKYRSVCRVHADTSVMAQTLQEQYSATGGKYYRQEYSVILLFGLVELKAQICWKENGIEKRSPATMVYEPRK